MFGAEDTLIEPNQSAVPEVFQNTFRLRVTRALAAPVRRPWLYQPERDAMVVLSVTLVGKDYFPDILSQLAALCGSGIF